MQNSHSILIVGGTGQVGSQVVQMLLEANYSVSILVRNTPESLAKAEPFVSAGATVVLGDLTDPNSLQNAADGIYAMICTAAALDHSFTAGYQALLASAARSGVEHVVYLSNVPRIEPLLEMFSAKQEIEEVIRTSGVAYTIVKAEPFLHYMVEYMIRMPIQYGYPVGLFAKNAQQAQQGSHYWICENDVAATLVSILGNEETFYKTYHVGGKFPLTFWQLVERYELLNDVSVLTQLHTEPPMGVSQSVYDIVAQLSEYNSETPDPIEELFGIKLTHPHTVLRESH